MNLFLWFFITSKIGSSFAISKDILETIKPFTFIVEGRKDLESKEGSRVTGERVRVKGGGNKKILERIRNINEIFLEIVENHTAGDPMNEGKGKFRC